MMLSIIIPAYNEEAAVEEVLNATKVAQKLLLSKKYFDTIEIIVVNDGSRDNTEKILQTISGIQIIKHDHNIGYGASLKAGFQVARGDTLAFLDADGTYDPRELPRLVEILRDHNADMVIGNRMHPHSHMPILRKIGNKIFATIVSVTARKSISDITSGMRIFRRDILASLGPLPDGLEFTTVMTSRAILQKNMNVVEIPISYSERRGASKLKVLRDGPRAFWQLLKIVLAPTRKTDRI